MIVVRAILQGKFGSGDQLAAANVAAMQAMSGSDSMKRFRGWRVLTDRSGSFDTVTIETLVDSIGDWEAGRDAMFAHPDFQAVMATTYDLVISGNMEYLSVEGEGKG